MRTARLVPTPFECKNTMMSRMTLCSAHAALILRRRSGPMPSTSSSLADAFSMMSKIFSPNLSTSFPAYAGPIPLTIPLARYFSIPSRVVGGVHFNSSARNCSPNCLSWLQRPSAVSHSPAFTEAREPTTVTNSRRARALTFSTAKPVSSLKNVTRSIRPDRLSTGCWTWLVGGFTGNECVRQDKAGEATQESSSCLFTRSNGGLKTSWAESRRTGCLPFQQFRNSGLQLISWQVPVDESVVRLFLKPMVKRDAELQQFRVILVVLDHGKEGVFGPAKIPDALVMLHEHATGE